MRHLCFVTFLFWLLPGLPFAATQTSVHDLQFAATATRVSHSVRILVIKPDKPLATVILFAGGSGTVQIEDDGTTTNQNFLVRSRHLFVQHGFTVAVVNAPSDRFFPDPNNPAEPIGLLGGFRRTQTYSDDIAGVIAFLRDLGPAVPLWLVGTSRGSTSAAYVAIRKRAGGGPDGIVLTSSLVVPVPPATTPIDNDSLLRVGIPSNSTGLSLSQINVPTLVMHHVNDQCSITPYAGVQPLLQGLTGAPKLEGMAIKGGSTPSGNPCQALHYHGFIGIEGAVVARMAHWIKFGFREKP